MLTIFSIPKAFKGHINIIQRNAVKSWVALGKNCEIFLLGQDEGVFKAAKEFGVKYIGNIKKNEFGTPYLDSAFLQVKKNCKNNILMYVNADIILTSGIFSAISKINKQFFLMSGRRWDLDINEEIDFDNPQWEKKIKEKAFKEGKLHGFSGMDYFIFPKNLSFKLPSFAVGRIGWDSWIVYNARKNKIPVIDATEAITAVHQNHDYSHSEWGKKERVEGPEMKKNISLAGGFSNMLSLREADFILAKNGLKRPGFLRLIYSKIALLPAWRFILNLKRSLQ